MFAWSSIGLFLFNEYKFYTTWQIAGIFGSAALCLVGVKALTMKNARGNNNQEEPVPNEEAEVTHDERKKE